MSKPLAVGRIVQTIYIILTVLIIASVAISWAKVSPIGIIGLLCVVFLAILVVGIVLYKRSRHAHKSDRS